MEIFYTRRAVKQLSQLPRLIQKRIADKMRFYREQSDPLKFAQHLTDYREGQFRFRVGDYRLVFDVVDDRIYVLKIDRRDKVYE